VPFVRVVAPFVSVAAPSLGSFAYVVLRERTKTSEPENHVSPPIEMTNEPSSLTSTSNAAPAATTTSALAAATRTGSRALREKRRHIVAVALRAQCPLGLFEPV